MLLQLNKNLRCIKEHIAKNKTNVVGAGPVSAHQTKDKNILKTDGVTMFNNLKNMKKTNIKMLLSMLIILIGLIIIPNSVKAAVDVDSLEWGTSTNYSDAYASYWYSTSDKYARITRCTPKGAEVVLPDEINGYQVICIENIFAFEREMETHLNITKIVLPKGLIKIGSHAFYECSNLTGELIIPDSVTIIEERAFTKCSSLTGELIIPDNVTSIGSQAFEGCSGFKGNLVIPNSVISIDNSAFDACDFGGTLTIGNKVERIGICAFYDNSFSGNLIIPDSVTSIEGSAFGCCEFAGNLILGNNLISIGQEAFMGCKGFTGDLVIPASVKIIESCAFDGCGFAKAILPSITPVVMENRSSRKLLERSSICPNEKYGRCI